MQQFLLATTGILLALPAYAGGDDNFSGGGSAFGSSFGNGFSGGGYGDTMSANAHDGFRGNSTVDSMIGFDDGSGGVRTYSYNPYHGTAQLVNVSGDGWTGYGGVDMRSGIGGGRTTHDIVAARETPTPSPRPTPMPTASPAPTYAPPDPAPTPTYSPSPLDDMGSVGAAVIELQPAPTPQGIVEDPVDTSLRAIQAAVVNDQHGAMTQEQKRVAAALNLAAGALMGRYAGGNHRLAQITGRPRNIELNASEGLIIGGVVAEVRRVAKGEKTPFDDFVRSLTEFSNAKFNRVTRELKNQIKDPERRERVISELKSVRQEQERRDRDDARADRKGGRGKTDRGNPNY